MRPGNLRRRDSGGQLLQDIPRPGLLTRQQPDRTAAEANRRRSLKSEAGHLSSREKASGQLPEFCQRLCYRLVVHDRHSTTLQSVVIVQAVLPAGPPGGFLKNGPQITLGSSHSAASFFTPKKTCLEARSAS
ncbi:MAG: hypothetical protein EBZ13_05405 [Planctomycetia bacterium]|nr:hypothetical protein [Planctomycetia bacterium]